MVRVILRSSRRLRSLVLGLSIMTVSHNPATEGAEPAAEREQPEGKRREPPQRVPDFFMVGHPKCGTQALYKMLKGHPQLSIPQKEPRYLASDLRDSFHIPATSPLPESFEEYLALFARAREDQLVGDCSPIYLSSRTAARAIAELQPAARIIAMLREPASFLRSLHLQFVQEHAESEQDLRKALALEEDRRMGKRLPRGSPRPNMLMYTDHVRYVEQLRRYHELFAPERVLVLIYDDFRRDNEGTVRSVLRFLGVDDTVSIDTHDRNPTVHVRAQGLYRVTHALASGRGPLARGLQATARTLAPRGMSRRSAVALRDRIFFTPPPPPDEQLTLDLRARFKPEVVALSEYLGRDLVSEWGYDGID
jgi:Sulfotransferase family